MRMPTRSKNTPLRLPRSRRPHGVTNMTSFKAGKITPIVAIPLLREDRVAGGNLQLQFAMEETEELLMNPVNGMVRLHFVPFSAFERFQGSIDVYNRSYKGQPPLDGETVIPWLEKVAGFGDLATNEIHKALGEYASPTDSVSTMFVEAYNLIVKQLYGDRSPSLLDFAPARLSKTLAASLWPQSRLSHIVPDWDQASSEGEVPISFVGGNLPIKKSNSTTAGLSFSNPTFNAMTLAYLSNTQVAKAGGGTMTAQNISTMAGNVDLTGLYAEMQEGAFGLSLANIELAKQTQWWANERKAYANLEDDWLIDLFMSGISVPDQGLMQPILLQETQTVFGMARRYATDAANLDKQAVNGASVVNVRLSTPQIPTGGVLMVTAEALPEQLWERMRNPFLHLGSIADLPDAMEDALDPEKVEIVRNGYVDGSHNDPNGLFGYAPLNHQFMMNQVRVGGKFLRPAADGTNDENRQRLWAVETPNPKLGKDFYIAGSVHQKPFKDTISDPFEVVALGAAVIEGLTVFGTPLVEAGDEYQTVMAQVDTDRIEKP